MTRRTEKKLPSIINTFNMYNFPRIYPPLISHSFFNVHMGLLGNALLNGHRRRGNASWR